ncbi:hypothetical protein ACEUZ9_002897 [Paracoccus litorisediminis]
MKQNPDAIFSASVPKVQHDDVLTRLAEAAWTGKGGDGLSIDDREEINALNHEIEGTIEIDGVEHWFHIRSGDRNGLEILGWNDGPGLVREPAPKKTLAPMQWRIQGLSGPISAGELLDMWDLALDPASALGAKLAALPAKAAYDAYFAPRTGASRSHHETAAKAGFEITEESEAIRIRMKLFDMMTGIAPLPQEIVRGNDPAGLYARWRDAHDPQTELGAEILRLRHITFRRMAETGARKPDPAIDGAILELGFSHIDKLGEIRLKAILARRMIETSPIDGFDPRTLPTDPMAELLRMQDPSMIPDTRVNPVAEMERLVDYLAHSMARKHITEVHKHDSERAERLGYRISIGRPDVAIEETAAPGY